VAEPCLAGTNAEWYLGATMTIYYVTVGKNEYKIEINGKQYKINGELVQAALVALKERGKYLLEGVARKTEIYIDSRGGSQYILNAYRRHAIAKVERGNGRSGRKAKTTSNGNLVAPISGIVISVHVAPGDAVETGQVLMVLESMKMQMEMRSACAGVVDLVNIQPRKQITKGELLIKINPAIPEKVP
jgi:biotin carboxyl carrier protein